MMVRVLQKIGEAAAMILVFLSLIALPLILVQCVGRILGVS